MLLGFRSIFGSSCIGLKLYIIRVLDVSLYQLTQLSLPSLRGQQMRTSFGWEDKDGQGSFYSWINAWVAAVIVRYVDNACRA